MKIKVIFIRMVSHLDTQDKGTRKWSIKIAELNGVKRLLCDEDFIES